MNACRWASVAVLVAVSVHACAASREPAGEGAAQDGARPPAVTRAPAAGPAPPSATAEAPAPAPAPKDGATGRPALPRRIEGMILVPAGPFTMGSDDGGEPDERPAHEVTLPDFYLDEHEATNQEYAGCVAAGPCEPPDPRNADTNGFGPDKRFRSAGQPISSITWFDAQAYCGFRGKRLPTEAELEKAARGTDGRRYPWGDDPPTNDHAVFGASVTANVGTHPKGAGPYGHLDLAGNVWEWVADVYDPFAYRREGAARGESVGCPAAIAAYDELRRTGRQGFTGSNPIPTECERVLRGGAFNYTKAGLRSSNRVHHPPRYHLVMSGFRCAKDATPAG